MVVLWYVTLLALVPGPPDQRIRLAGRASNQDPAIISRHDGPDKIADHCDIVDAEFDALGLASRSSCGGRRQGRQRVPIELAANEALVGSRMLVVELSPEGAKTQRLVGEAVLLD